MSPFILSQKATQSQLFDSFGRRLPVTVLVASSCFLVDIICQKDRGYCAIKLGFGKVKKTIKPIKGQLDKAGIKTPLRFLKEIRLRNNVVSPIEENGKKGLLIGETKLFIGDILKPDLLFKPGDLVNVTSQSKGKGFQGVVRRHHFAGGPRTHGQSDRERAPGAMGQTTTPGRTYKGKRMAGRMGGKTVTVKRLKVVASDGTKLIVKGLVPGAKKSLVSVIKK